MSNASYSGFLLLQDGPKAIDRQVPQGLPWVARTPVVGSSPRSPLHNKDSQAQVVRPNSIHVHGVCGLEGLALHLKALAQACWGAWEADHRKGRADHALHGRLWRPSAAQQLGLLFAPASLVLLRFELSSTTPPVRPPENPSNCSPSR